MARGWESKAIEAQIENAEAGGRAAKKHLTPQEIEIVRRKESLLLSRKRIVEEMKTSRNPRYKKMLGDALADLDEKLSELG